MWFCPWMKSLHIFRLKKQFFSIVHYVFCYIFNFFYICQFTFLFIFFSSFNFPVSLLFDARFLFITCSHCLVPHGLLAHCLPMRCLLIIHCMPTSLLSPTCHLPICRLLMSPIRYMLKHPLNLLLLTCHHLVTYFLVCGLLLCGTSPLFIYGGPRKKNDVANYNSSWFPQVTLFLKKLL